MTWTEVIGKAIDAGIGFTIQRPINEFEALTLTIFIDGDDEEGFLVCQGAETIDAAIGIIAAEIEDHA